ncbi:MAG: CDP-diacylglycerol--glycerol-3-phosphate 3-phosphatidyltransferase [Bacillota bacterium]
MNLPNKLTMLRILIIPLLIILYYVNPDKLSMNTYNIVILALFIIAAVTDFFDGYIARKQGLVTTFGKFSDPLADKLLVMAALLILMDVGVIAMWIIFVILAREFIVTGIRLVAMSEGDVIAASKLGKIKTASTMVALTILLIYPSDGTVLFTIGNILLYIGVLFTVISGIEYFYKNRLIIFKTK